MQCYVGDIIAIIDTPFGLHPLTKETVGFLLSSDSKDARSEEVDLHDAMYLMLQRCLPYQSSVLRMKVKYAT